MNIGWTNTPEELLAWAEIVLGWTVVNYLLARDPSGLEAIRRMVNDKTEVRWVQFVVIRSIALGLVTFVIVQPAPASLLLAATILVGALALPLGRHFLVSRAVKVEAEFEIITTFLLIVWAGWIIGANHLEIGYAPFRVPLSWEQLVTLCVVSSTLIFAGQGGTHIVRGVLDKIGAAPKVQRSSGAPSTAEEIDTTEYNRGRVIGNLERWLMILTVALGSYAALGFLVAAKGLVRMKELEKREFAEYFLIGTLTSVLIALLLGLLLRAAVKAWW